MVLCDFSPLFLAPPFSITHSYLLTPLYLFPPPLIPITSRHPVLLLLLVLQDLSGIFRQSYSGHVTLTPRFRMSEMIGLKAFQVRREEERTTVWTLLGHACAIRRLSSLAFFFFGLVSCPFLLLCFCLLRSPSLNLSLMQLSLPRPPLPRTRPKRRWSTTF